MHVLFIVTAYPSEESSYQGIFHKTLAESLQRHGIQVQVVAPVPYVPPGLTHLKQRWKTYSEIPEKYILNGIEIFRPRYLHIPNGDYWAMPHILFQKVVKSAIANRPDIIHAHYAYPPGLAAIGLSKMWKIPTVLTLHGSDVNSNPHVNDLARKRFKKAVRGASKVVAVSKALAEGVNILSGCMPEIIPIGINLQKYSQTLDRETARKMLGLPLDKTLVLYVGALVREKGVQELRDAILLLDPAKTIGILVGDGPLKKEMSESKNIFCVGSQQNEKIQIFMSACNILVLASYAEGMPTVLVEAGAAGVPVIASRVGGIPELLGNDRGFLIEPKNVDALTDALNFVQKKSAETKQRAVNLRYHVQKYYDADRNSLTLIELYHKAIEDCSRFPKTEI